MSMREKYQSLALIDLKEIAKTRGIKGTSSMKKADVIDAMVALDEKEAAAAGAAPLSGAAPLTGVAGTEEKQTARKSAARERKAGAAEGAGKSRAGEEGRDAGAGRAAAESQSTGAGRAGAESQSAGAGRAGAEGQGAGMGAGAESQNAGMGRAGAEGQNAESRNGGAGRAAAESQSAGPGGAENRTAAGKASDASQPDRVVYVARNGAAGRTQDKRPMRRNPQGQAEGNGRRPSELRTSEAKGNYETRSTAEPRTAAEPRAEYAPQRATAPAATGNEDDRFPAELDSGISANGILEVMPDGYGFIRCANYLPGENDVYVAPSQIRRFGLKTGDIVEGNTRIKTQNEKFSALLYVKSINGYAPDVAARRYNFEDMTPIFPEERISLELSRSSVAMRIMDLISPVGKGQRGLIVSPPKAGKTTLLKQVAQSVKVNNPDMHLIILLIDERPEEVTDFREAIEGPNVEVIYSTFDELPEHHKRVAEMVIERAKRLVEHKKDVMILLDSITRLTRAYNLVVPPSGRTLSGGLDPAALHMPKRFFGAARNMREGGSLTILATALVDTGSKMDDVIYEEFKGTGNMEIVLDRKLSEKRVFPAIDIPKSSTRREDLLLSPEELEAMGVLRKALNGLKPEEAVDKILDMFARTRSNVEFVNVVRKMKFI